MWKYFVIWGVYIIGYNAQPMDRDKYQLVYNDTSYFNSREAATAFINSANVQGAYMQPPYAKFRRGKAFNFVLDSTWIEEPKRKGFLFFNRKHKQANGKVN